MQVFIDNIPVQYPNDTLLKPHFTLRKQDETGDKAFSFSGDLELEGADAAYIYKRLVTDPNAIINEVILKFVDDCCTPAKEFLFKIKPESLKWCDEESCTITAAASEYTLSQDQLNCLKSTLIWDDYAGFKSKQHPRFSYCNELRPNWLHDIMILLFFATFTSMLIIGPVILGLVLAFNTVNAIINAINSGLNLNINNITLGGNTNIDFNDLQNYNNLLLASMVGCGRKHPSPLVRDYAQNVCGKCGLTFVSSIFNSPLSDYYNTCYVNAPVHKGTLETDTTTYWLDENKPLLNGYQFFNQIIGPHNGRWQIVNSQLILEREDFFVPKTPWINLTTHTGVIDTCYKWTNKPRYSYLNFEYQKDPINEVGGEARDRWNDIVEWNPTGSPLQKDEFHPLIEFAACRFRDDGIDRDVLSFYKNWPHIGPVIQRYDNAMLMNSHKCFTPMLLIWDPNTGVANAKVDPGVVFFPGFPGVALNQFYNYPYWVEENYPGNLYDRFWYIKNPNYAGWAGKDFESQIIFGCDDIANLDLDGMAVTKYGNGEVELIDIDYESKTLTIKGTV